MIITITIKYNGKYSVRTGIESEEILVDDQISEAYKSIMDHLKLKYQIVPPFLLMVRGMHIIGAVKKDIKLNDGDIFQVLPFLSGG